MMIECDENVAAVWQTIFSDDAEWLAVKIQRFNLTRDNVARALKEKPRGLREKAFLTILRNRVHRGGIMAPGAGLVKTGENGRGLLSRWYPETLARRIREIAHIRHKFAFTAGDGIESIRAFAQDRRVAFFVDPPYTVAARRLYHYWQIDHRALFEHLAQVEGDVLLTYDNTQEIAALAKEFGFDSEVVAMKNTHHARMTELLIGKNLSWLKDAVAVRESRLQNEQGTLAFRQ